MINSVSPDSTTAALAAEVPLEKKKDEELPGTFPVTPAAELEKGGDFSVNPLPAAEGALNPIKLAPGEKIPESLIAEGTTNNVKLDPESYEKSDTLPGKPFITISLSYGMQSTHLTVSYRWCPRYSVLCRALVYDCCIGCKRPYRDEGP